MAKRRANFLGVIGSEDRAEVLRLTQQYWQETVRSGEFRALFAGKEIGHRIADYVDEHTTAVLDRSFDTRHELGGTGNVRARSMGDVWLRSQGIYNPINVKAGEAG